MPKVFISYRRADRPFAAKAIYDRLVSRYGAESVIFDVNTIPLGEDFEKYLRRQVSQCDAFLAIIGEDWLDALSDDGSRRLDDPADFVRIEIYAALKRDIPVIPVLIDQDSMPARKALPRSLRALLRHNAAKVRSGRGSESDLDLLVCDLDRMFSQVASIPELHQKKTATAKPGNAPVPPRARAPSRKVAKTTAAGISSRSIKSAEVDCNSIGMPLKLVSAGEFTMGSPNSAAGVRDDEKPQYRVRITKPFYLGVYQVTQEEYGRVMDVNPSQFKGDDRRPVETVTWHSAVKFCNTLSDQEKLEPFYRIDGRNVSIIGGSGYRLPTEAEWEFACRAGTTTKWSFGDMVKNLESVGWFKNNSGGRTHAVGSLRPNDFGLFEMHGNVWEWCWDWYGEYDGASVAGPSGPISGDGRVLRGGAFNCEADGCRSAIRFEGPPRYRYYDIGFRVARSHHGSP